MPPAGYKRKSTGSLPKKPTAAKFKRLSELEISPLLEIRSTSKALTTSKKQASPEAKAPPSLFNSFSSVSFSPAVIKRRPVYSNALNAKMSSLDQSSSIISKLTGQTYGYKKEEKTTSVEILEQKKKKATTKGKTSAKKAAAHECSPTEPAKNKKYLPRNLFMNDKDVSIEYPTTVNSGKNDKSRNYSKTAEVIQSLDNKQTKVENKKRISNRKSEVMFDALKMIDESATIPTSQVKDAMIKVQNIANSRQNEPPEKLKARIREQEIIFREPKKVPVQTRKIEEPSKKNLDVLTKTTSGVTSDQLMQKFRVEMKSLLSNFYSNVFLFIRLD
uniref:Uncharacterized protein n=1 Tax=Romanomermis culicivorax TaxID=13658 RepID=A0A915KZ05_ROMCU